MQKAQKLIVGNWKMYGQPATAAALIQHLVALDTPAVQVVICPPATLLTSVAWQLSGSGMGLGAQDCHAQKEGAFTGDVSADMLKAAGCSYVIVGHSERRHYHQETDAQVRSKAVAAIAAGLIPIICIGESLADREAGRAEAVVQTQLQASLPETAALNHFVLAYEPVWAIGSGKTPTSHDIEQMHAAIRQALPDRLKEAAILYGGSVKAANAKEILALAGVNGVLVGGASLKADEFSTIIASA
ncbi:MAG: triose-phosphate isomerase [Rickettsiales bacterium]|nr:triose-phosphate isomerase [Rickettsiales bacterium]